MLPHVPCWGLEVKASLKPGEQAHSVTKGHEHGQHGPHGSIRARSGQRQQRRNQGSVVDTNQGVHVHDTSRVFLSRGGDWQGHLADHEQAREAVVSRIPRRRERSLRGSEEGHRTGRESVLPGTTRYPCKNPRELPSGSAFFKGVDQLETGSREQRESRTD